MAGHLGDTLNNKFRRIYNIILSLKQSKTCKTSSEQQIKVKEINLKIFFIYFSKFILRKNNKLLILGINLLSFILLEHKVLQMVLF